MKTIPQISESELEVMKALWEYGNATSSQIIERLSQTAEWKPKTVQTFINRLVTKGAVKPVKTESKAFMYTPLVCESDFKASANKSFLEKVYDGSVNLMLASFIKEQQISKEEIESLRRLLDEEV